MAPILRGPLGLIELGLKLFRLDAYLMGGTESKTKSPVVIGEFPGPEGGDVGGGEFVGGGVGGGEEGR